jgi:hypothetical protein
MNREEGESRERAHIPQQAFQSHQFGSLGSDIQDYTRLQSVEYMVACLRALKMVGASFPTAILARMR